MDAKAAKKLAEINWTYADHDSAACAELTRRISGIGRTKGDFLTYSQLVEEVTFCLPNVDTGEPFQITEWNSLERAIIGDFLGKIAAISYLQGGFLASSLVIGVESNSPGGGLYTLARDVGLLRSRSKDHELQFWMEQTRLARAWYISNSTD